VHRYLTSSAERDLAVDLIKRLDFALGPTLQLVRKPDLRAANFSSKNLALSQLMPSFRGASETLEMIVTDWIEAKYELLLRLHRDHRLLEAILFGHKLDPCVRHLNPALSDPHNKGRTVTSVTFCDGRRVIYKPRSCVGEICWFQLLDAINRQGFWPRFCIPKLIDRRHYSWMAFVKSRSCRSSNEARRLYFRWGAETRLAELLRLRDLHRENWIAAGSQPILVDAEMMGSLNQAGTGCGESSRPRCCYDLLSLGLFPLYPADRLGVYDGAAPFDAMLRPHEPVTWLPKLEGKIALPQAYVRELVAGYRQMAKPWADRIGTAILQIHRKIRNSQRRLLYRATAEYYEMLKSSLQPVYMLNEGDRRAYLLTRCRSQRKNRERAGMEVNELVRCSIPRFTAQLVAEARPRDKLTANQLKLREKLFWTRILRTGRRL
jgi:lantibiotic modifying enzyme